MEDSLTPPPYTAAVLRKIENAPGTWNSIEVGVFRADGERHEQVGAYIRNYPTLFRTFCAFRVDGRDYALYSGDYTATRVMELPSCRDIGGEERSGGGFCPVDYYVPCYVEREYVRLDDTIRRHRVNEPEPCSLRPGVNTYTPLDPATGQRTRVEKPAHPVSPLLYYPFGFVAGCIWGDDSSWKIQYLDLSRAAQGIIRREERFGYIALPDGLPLKDAIGMEDYGTDPEEEWSRRITIAVEARFDLETGRLVERGVPWDE
jgi:hypothetical protein